MLYYMTAGVYIYYTTSVSRNKCGEMSCLEVYALRVAFLVAYQNVRFETFRVSCKSMSENNVMAANLSTVLLHTRKHKRAGLGLGHEYASGRNAVEQQVRERL